VAYLAPQCKIKKSRFSIKIDFDCLQWSRRVFRRGALKMVLHCPPHYLPTENIKSQQKTHHSNGSTRDPHPPTSDYHS